jgi:serine/threonine-protein kinase
MQIEQLGPYRVGSRLGKGGMGSVYEAVHAKTGQRVAIKALTPQLAAAEGFRERFESEIESLKKLQHEGIVRLYGYGEDGGVLFYSMELVDGPSLEQEINAGRRFDWNETLTIAIQVCRALKHAHDHGVVHRDIKPANLLLAAGDRVKIADFGIARLFGATQLTNVGGILGTADYMSPEQVDGRPVTDRCDQYALGCVMFALLAGRPPFRANTMPEMLQLQRFAEPEPVRRYAPQTPEQLDRLIGQLLNKDPAGRFPNVLVLGRHMEAMQKALSRPPKSSPTPNAKTPGAAPKGLAATAAPGTDATLAHENDGLPPLDTTDSGVYNAPTLADDGQVELAEPAPPSQSAPGPIVRPVAAPPRETRFTTVDDAARSAQREQAERWTLGLQLAGLAAALAALAWVGWRLARPATADELYATMIASLEETGGDPREIEAEVTQFLERFSDDKRAVEVQGYADELELQRLERRQRFRSRVPAGQATNPVEQVYADAVALIDVDPMRAAKMLEDLLALYPDVVNDEPGGGDASTSRSVKPYLVLAERQLEKLRSTLKQRAGQQLPQLEERLQAARRLERNDPQRAAGIYQALINLYADERWASRIVDDARTRLEDLSAYNAGHSK